jgi:hypothetical protein
MRRKQTGSSARRDLFVLPRDAPGDLHGIEE